ncbi:MAG: hypothetical protein M3Q68_04205, partial [Actinomycetota bacterium]|nr:hypothetical protein [Actinomycetota bacterium]
MSAELVLTAVPAGLTPTGLRVAVTIGFRLAPSGTLADFPALAAWPTTLAGIQWGVRFDSTLDPSVPVTAVSEPVEWALWSSLFPSATPVTAHVRPDLRARVVRTYSASHVAERIGSIYGTLSVESADDHPTIAQLGPQLTAIRTARRADLLLARQVHESKVQQVFEGGGAVNRAADLDGELVALGRFFDRGRPSY